MIDVNTLCTPEGFFHAFRAVCSNHTPPFVAYGSNTTEWTKWIERMMLELAQSHKLYCQNKEARRSGLSKEDEWMKIDHIFVDRYANDCFPLIAVEHENGDIKPAVEWALWKCLSVRCSLSVLVAYPNQKQRETVLDSFRDTIRGWEQRFGALPNMLLLMGWWTNQDSAAINEDFPYEALALDNSGNFKRLIEHRE